MPVLFRTERLVAAAVTATGLLVASAGAGAGLVPLSRPDAPGDCRPGARTLAQPGSILYPETGNGGYTSVHTDVRLRYDADRNRLLPGTMVQLTDRATQCLSELSLDFERGRLADPVYGPRLQVASVEVDGIPASFGFAVPTYPGDPAGPGDPDPRAHQASQTNPVGGPKHNPLPPACTPQLPTSAPGHLHDLDGTPCPANKLVIRPARPIPAGALFVVTVRYSGKPGTHQDGSGSRDGWYATPGGNSMATEPVGTQAWMPLNNHPSAKPSYDFTTTVAEGKTVLANGVLTGVTHHRPDPDFPTGSATWHWHAPFPVASYLALSIVGDYSLRSHIGADGRRYYQAQDRHIPAGLQAANALVMNRHEEITAFEEQLTGPYPFPSDGVVAGVPGIPDNTEEMQTMIVFTHSAVDLTTLYHETMHQWWGDNVTESRYEETFFKEGLATFSESALVARREAQRAGGLSTPRGRSAFERSLARQFAALYAKGGSFWSQAPSRPSAVSLFDGDSTYARPGAAYLALRAILGADRFTAALEQIQRRDGGGTITEAELRAEFAEFLPTPSPACRARLSTFFDAWFDTAYPDAGGATRPAVTGPGLAGPGFFTAACPG